jgi:hypothetical protein
MLQSLSLLPLESLAKASGFVLRRPRKLSLEAFLQSILLSLCQPSYSLGAWAAQLSALQAGLFSKQALHRRCGQGLVNFLQLLMSTLLGAGWAGLSRRSFSPLWPRLTPGQYHPEAPPLSGEIFSRLR